MNTVATLIVKAEANRPGSLLNATTFFEARDRLRTAGAKLGPNRILSEGEAADIYFDHVDVPKAQAALDAAFSGRQIDIFCQRNEDRRKRLLLADMDSTIITAECIDEIADVLGIKDQVAPITEAAMRGELDFEAALRERVALLAGLDRKALGSVWKERIHFTPGARELIATMRHHGAHTVLVSGGFTFFAERVMQDLGFSECHANSLIFDDDKLTGAVSDPIIGASAKEETLVACRQRLGLRQSEIMVVGDGANDIPMLQAAGLGVAYYAKPETKAATKATGGTAITQGDLTSLLFLQGYSRDEFVTDSPE